MAKAHVQSVDEVTLERDDQGLHVRVGGMVPTAGWTRPELVLHKMTEPHPDGIYRFDFLAEPPGDPVAQFVSPIHTEVLLRDVPDDLKGVRVHAETNHQEARL